MRPRSARSRAIVTAIAALAATFAVVATASAATVVGAREIHDTLVAGARIGAEAPYTQIRFDLNANNGAAQTATATVSLGVA